MSRFPREKGTLPEYASQQEIDALLRAAPHGQAKLVMLVMWRAGLRVSEALGLEVRDVLFDDEPCIRVRRGKGNRPRLVPLHPELGAALRTAIDFAPGRAGSRRQGNRPLFDVTRRTVARWVARAVDGAAGAGVIAPGRQITAHTLRHSFARHALASGTPLNELSVWLGHRSIETTLIYLQLLPDPTGRMERIP